MEKRTYKNNKRFISNKLIENKEFLDNIAGYSLDDKQREIVLSEEDSTLVIAGAGSGKTLTIIARIMYLIKEGIDSKDILCISFTNATCNSLKTKLKEMDIDMEVLTFHKLGMNILKMNNVPCKIADSELLFNTVEKVISGEKDLKKLFPDLDFVENDDEMEEVRNNIILNIDDIKEVKKLFLTFINLFKGNNYETEKFNDFIDLNKKEQKNYLKYKNHKFLCLARKMLQEYNDNLDRYKQVDFHDMINKAIDLLKDKEIDNYKYIIIDEYQDISLAKCELIKKLKECTRAKLLVVGDDWQSIYRFTGSNLNVFTQFKYFFPFSKIFKLENTYRNSQELLDISSKFILKNKKQIVKKLKSNKKNSNPVYIYYYENNYIEILNKLIKEIKTDILILGRNNKDLPKINNPKVRCMTVHKSKGLECDNVIIVNLEDKVMGFPNKIVSDEVLKYVTNIEDIYPFEEERRLFYVALTRTKNNVYLLANRNNPSIFVQEILKDNKIINENLCPLCQANLIIKSGKNNLFYGCSNYPECNYTRKIN